MSNLADRARSLTNAASDAELIELAVGFRDKGYDDVEAIARLAEALANSGDVETFPHSADIASTGGPSSLSTLVCPLFLVLAGWNVPKVTVPGRPAGGIDVLSTIPGYKTRPDVDEMRSWLVVAHYVHAEAADRWAPLDGRLFRLRQQHGLQAVTPLVVASILAKKKALNLERAGVEIRRGPFGNLGNDDRDLRHAADLFEVVAERLNIRCTTTITGDGRPYQGKIGRGEALVAVSEILNGASSQDLAQHVTLCEKMAERAIGQPVEWSPKSLREVFMGNLEVQGSSYQAFTERVDRVLAQPRKSLLSRGSGILQWDLGSIRDAIMRFQSPTPRDVDAAGVELLTLGGPVEAGQRIASVRGNPELVDVLQSSYSVTQVRMIEG